MADGENNMPANALEEEQTEGVTRKEEKTVEEKKETMDTAVSDVPGRDGRWIQLDKKFITFLFVYYAIILVASAFFCGYRMTELIDHGKQAATRSGVRFLDILFVSFSSGILGTSFYYIRKLYKACLQGKVESKSISDIPSLGAKAYFIFRPLLGAVISVIAVLIVYIGLFFLVEQPIIEQDKFFIFVFVLSFMFGFSNGKLITNLERSRSRIADRVNFSNDVKA